ncbi:YbaB/EbfC family nucleoid-associated protein [Candidatus Uhrbacteria bacterium]|nr:YbaB/EbfC family nucleoid-associated protein [Candidatus Uhrbacteria bacterium]
MSVLDKLKDLNELRKHGKELKALQGQLAKEQAVGTSSDGMVVVVLDGNQNVISVRIDDALIGNKAQLEKSVKDALFRALDALKKMMASKFSSFLK